jgi:hypothetical protein
MREQPMMRTESVLQRFTQVAQQVPAVGNLHSSWCRHTRGLSVNAAAIPAHDLAPRMLSKPRGHRSRLAIGQQIDHLAALQIAQDRAVAMAFSPRPVVDAKHPRSDYRRPPGSAAKLSQQRRTTDQQAKTTSQASSGLSSQSKRDPVQCFRQSVRPPGVASGCTWQLFGKNASTATGLDTEELPYLQENYNRQLLPGKVCELAEIAAVNAP